MKKLYLLKDKTEFIHIVVITCIFQIENIRRRHNYLPFIMELLKILAEDGKLVGLVEKVRYSVHYKSM